MNDDLQHNSFDELLGAALEDYVHNQPGPGLDRRILANLATRHPPMRWGLWVSFAAALALASVTISLHILHRPSTPPTTIARVPHDHEERSVTSGDADDVSVGTVLSAHRYSKRTPVPAISWTATNAAPLAAESHPSSQQVLRDSTEAEISAQTPPPTTAANGEVKIEPIHIAPLVVPPLPGAEANAQPIPPIDVEPIHIAPIQISRLEIDRPDSN